MKNESLEVQDILRLKAYEQPDADFESRFLRDFHAKQRESLQNPKPFEGMRQWFGEVFHGSRAYWTYGLGAAYVVGISAVVMVLNQGESQEAKMAAELREPALRPVSIQSPQAQPAQSEAQTRAEFEEAIIVEPVED